MTKGVNITRMDRSEHSQVVQACAGDAKADFMTSSSGTHTRARETHGSGWEKYLHNLITKLHTADIDDTILGNGCCQHCI